MYEFSGTFQCPHPGCRCPRCCKKCQALFQASLVSYVLPTIQTNSAILCAEPLDDVEETQADCVLPILNAWGLVGEIQIWRGEFGVLPAEDSPIASKFCVTSQQEHLNAYNPLKFEKSDNEHSCESLPRNSHCINCATIEFMENANEIPAAMMAFWNDIRMFKARKN